MVTFSSKKSKLATFINLKSYLLIRMPQFSAIWTTQLFHHKILMNGPPIIERDPR